MMQVSPDNCRRILVVNASEVARATLSKALLPAHGSSRTHVELERERATRVAPTRSESSNKERAEHVPEFVSGIEEAVSLVLAARSEKQPYAVAFIDVDADRSGGLELTARLLRYDPVLQIVLCTASPDDSWADIRSQFWETDRLILLQTPFSAVAARQHADVLAEKWRLARDSECRMQELERHISERNRDWIAIQSIDAQLAGDNRRLRPVAKKEQRDLVVELHRALRAGELILNYQPLVDIASRRVVGLETLVRWTHPVWGPVAPAEFIPVAESSGLILPIGEFVLKTACEQTMQWQRAGVPVVPVSVNISAVQLQRQDLWNVVRSILRSSGVPPHLLALEITESTFMTDAQQHAGALQGLRGDGVQVHIDDFGTGYSSLSYLKHLPADTLKIDRSFIAHLVHDSKDEIIVRAILAMTRSLGIHAVAEGVETPTQLEVLGRHGCQVAQGYYFCRPIPADQCRDLLIDLGRRTNFTDTLRMRVNASSKPNSVIDVGVYAMNSSSTAP